MNTEEMIQANEQAKHNILNFIDSIHKHDISLAELHYEISQESYFYNNYETIKEKSLSRELSKCNVLLLTANSVEKGILHYSLYEQQKKVRPKIQTILSEDIAYYFFMWGKYKVVHVHQNDTGSFTRGGSHDILEKVLSLFTPNFVLSIGVAFGIDPLKQQIGNVLVSKRVLPYDIGTKRKDDMIIIKSPQFEEIDAWLKCRFQYCQPFLRQEGIQYGDIVTGGSVISDPVEKERILNAFSEFPNENIIGGEMEGAGLFKACQTKGVSCAVIKGICDWATMKNDILDDEKEDEKLKDNLQGYAMNQAIKACSILFDDVNLFVTPKTRQKRQKQETILYGLLSFFFINTILLLLWQKPITDLTPLIVFIALAINSVISLIITTELSRLQHSKIL